MMFSLTIASIWFRLIMVVAVDFIDDNIVGVVAAGDVVVVIII